MARREKITAGEFKEIKIHWDLWTEDGHIFGYNKNMKGLEEILRHCNFCHHVPEILPSQKDKLLERLIKSDAQTKAKRQ
ncbi:MAG: hypothetical protein NTZ84_00145 [Candidatus Nealsonbacteria bacterium]|nr:hypothetical protein [Candidatus Nealsonbacteria bacterium]